MSPARGGEEKSSTTFAVIAFHAWFAITAGWWALAFAPLPVPPVWLAAARSVCFGTLPNGLPDTWGWILLALAPLSILGFLLAVWGRDLRRGLRRLAHRPTGLLLLAAVVATTVAGAASVGARVTAAGQARAAVAAVPQRPFPSDLEPGTTMAPPLVLVDQHGAEFDLAGLLGGPALVTFAYGHCTTVCPTLVETVRRAAADSGPDPPPLVVVTLDPWRDTPGSLPGLARAWGLDEIEGARLLSGEVDRVARAIAAWGVDSARDPRTGEITHPAWVFVVDSEGRLAYRFLSPPASWLVDAVRELGKRG